MKTYTGKDLEAYLKNDWILDMLRATADETDQQIRTHQWLMEMDAKRLIYADVYGDILKEKTSRRVLDVGGGYSALTKVLAANSQYTLLDFMAHGGTAATAVSPLTGLTIQWLNQDWYNAGLDKYDMIIANDLFPDVDQRMEVFIERMLPHCSELRLVMTYYNSPRFYTTKRVDDTEVLTFLSWDGEITGMKLKRFLSRCNATGAEIDSMKDETDSIYRNGRHVSYVVIRGDL